MSGYTYETELELDPNWKDAEGMTLSLALELTCTEYGVAPSGMCGPPEFYDPGSGPEFQLDECRIEFGEDKKGETIPDLVLNHKQFDAFFGDMADKLFDAACEEASETGEFG